MQRRWLLPYTAAERYKYYGELMSPMPHTCIDHTLRIGWIDATNSTPSNWIRWWIPSIFVPAQVQREISSYLLIRELLKNLERVERIVSLFTLELREDVSFSESAWTGSQQRPKIPGVQSWHVGEGAETTWSYAFNPYRLLSEMLDQCADVIRHAHHSKLSDFDKATLIYRRTRRLADGIDLAFSTIR